MIYKNNLIFKLIFIFSVDEEDSQREEQRRLTEAKSAKMNDIIGKS